MLLAKILPTDPNGQRPKCRKRGEEKNFGTLSYIEEKWLTGHQHSKISDVKEWNIKKQIGVRSGEEIEVIPEDLLGRKWMAKKELGGSMQTGSSDLYRSYDV